MIDINEEFDDKKRRDYLIYYTFSKFTLPVISLCFYLLIYMLDKGPTLPPFSQETESIDCNSLSYKNYSIHDGVIDFYLHQKETINFPPEYVPHFISLYTINNENISMEYKKAYLKNMSLINGTIKFTLSYPISSEIIVFFKCLDKDFAQQRVTLTEVNETDDNTFSTKVSSATDFARMTNVCFENTKFLFFTPVPGYSETIPFNQTKIRFEVLAMHLDSYLKMKNVSRTNETSFLIPPLDPIPWKSMLFNLLPISLSLESLNESITRKFHFLFREAPLKGSFDVIKRFSTITPVKIKDIQCFKKILLPRSVSNYYPNTESIEVALSQNFTYLRSIFPKTGIQKRKIVLSSNLEDILKPIIEEICEECDLSILQSSTSVTNAADISHSAQIFIGNHFYNLVNMIWLTPNKTVLIDATPSKYACSRWAEVYSKFNNITYYRVNKISESCNCTNFECYPKIIFGNGENSEKPDVDIESFRKILKDALNTTSRFEEEEITPTPQPSNIHERPDHPDRIGYPGNYRFV